MGEYIRESADGEQVAKLGTCESWGYIRRDECFLLRQKGYHYDGDWKYIDSNDRQGPIFRFPWPDEDCFIQRGPAAIIAEMNKRDMYYHKSFRIPEELAADIDHRKYHFNPSGKFGRETTCNSGCWILPCPNSRESQSIGEWSNGGSRYQISLVGERQNENGWYTVFGCPYCGNIFALEQEDVGKLELPELIMQRVKAFVPFEE